MQNTLSVSFNIHSFFHLIIHPLFPSEFLPKSSTIETVLKLEVQLQPSPHDSKNSLLSLWLCHGFVMKTMFVWFMG